MENPNFIKKYKVLIVIVLIIILILAFRPFTWIKTTLSIKALEYRSTHDPVSLSSLKIKNKNLPMLGKITKNYIYDNKGIDISPSSYPTNVRITDIGVVIDIGYNDIEKNYVKVRHVSEIKKDIYYTYYSNLPDKPQINVGKWVGSSTILYSGNNLDYLHFEVLDFNGNNIDPTKYINIE